MKKYLEYFLSLNVLTQEKKHNSALNRARSYADLPTSEILPGEGMPHEIGKLSFSQIRVKYQGLHFGAFHSFIVRSSLCPPWPPTIPQGIQMEKCSFQSICTKKALGSRGDFSQKHLSVLWPFPRAELTCWGRILAPYPGQSRSFGWRLSLHILGCVPEST